MKMWMNSLCYCRFIAAPPASSCQRLAAVGPPRDLIRASPPIEISSNSKNNNDFIYIHDLPGFVATVIVVGIDEKGRKMPYCNASVTQVRPAVGSWLQLVLQSLAAGYSWCRYEATLGKL